tara:strand:- start:10 stop:615 length:606 start_codon:yes stop_codon:yes gene_type:complete
MKSVYQFIIKPLGERYSNEIDIDGKKLIINSSISDHKFVNRLAIVVSTPLAYKSKIKKGDTVIVHHNLFRRYYNIKGKSVNSSTYFKDDLYFAGADQVYMYKRNNNWQTNGDYCFVKPVLNEDDSSLDKLKKNVGIIKYGNSSLEALNMHPEDFIGFKRNREFEFLVDKELLYCMQSNDILIKYENKRNQTEYNPSWANSS